MALSLDIIIRARDATSAAFAGARARMAAFGSSIKTALGGAVRFARNAAVAVAAFGASVVVVARKAINAHLAQAQSAAKLAATLKATGYAAGLTSGELIKQAAALQKVTGVGDETIVSMQGILATFRNIKGDTFKEATALIVDMGAALGKAGKGSADVESSVIQVGKALNDPIAGISALNRVGIQFTEQQKQQVKAMQEAGDMAGAQRIILDELANQFGGTAKAMADAARGTMQLKAAFGDAMEEVGRVILDTDKLDGLIKRMTDSLVELVEGGHIELWAEKAAAAIGPVLGLLQKIGMALSWTKEKIAETSAFYGALAGGASAREAVAAMTDAPAAVAQDNQNRLAQIVKARAEKQAAKDAAERKAVEAAAGIAGAGPTMGGAGGSSQVSQALQNMLARLSEQGHKTEQYGTQQADRQESLLERIAVSSEATSGKIDGIMTSD